MGRAIRGGLVKSQRTGGSAGREGDCVDAVMANSSRGLRVELMCK